MSSNVGVCIYWINLNSLALFWYSTVKKRKLNSRCILGSSCLRNWWCPKAPGTWISQYICFAYAVFPFSFPQCGVCVWNAESMHRVSLFGCGLGLQGWHLLLGLPGCLQQLPRSLLPQLFWNYLLGLDGGWKILGMGRCANHIRRVAAFH